MNQETYNLFDFFKEINIILTASKEKVGCTDNVTDIGVESEIGESTSNSGLVSSVHFRTNAFEKGMDPSSFLPIVG